MFTINDDAFKHFNLSAVLELVENFLNYTMCTHDF